MAKNEHKSTSAGLVWRLSQIVVWAVLIFGSLISFPNVFPWVLLGWLIFYAYLLLRKGTSWVPLLFCLILIVIKLPEPTIWLALLALMLVVQLSISSTKVRSRFVVPIFFFWIVYLASGWWGTHSSLQTKFEPDRPIVCLGDSLTDYGYPQVLQKLVISPIEDFGFNGYTTSDGVKLLPQIVALNPQAVIIELGGHDYKDGKWRSETKNNLESIINECHDAGARIVMVEIPRGFVSDPYYGLERQLARKHDLELIPDSMIRRIVFWSPVVPPGMWVGKSLRNSNDGLHPNDRGNKMMADYVVNALANVFGDEIRTRDE